MTREEIIEAIQHDDMMPFLQDWEARDVVDFVLKNIRQEPPEDLEEAARVSAYSITPTWPESDIKSHIKGFIAGAEWQRKQDQQLIELAEDHAMLAGMNKMKEEMMEKAVVAEVVAGKEGDKWLVTYVGDYESMLKVCKTGDRVKIIIVKED